MTPAELQAFIDGKVKIRKLYDEANLKHQDTMMAFQTARIINMINLRGKEMVLADDLSATECMVFPWDEPAEPEQEQNPEERMRKIQAYMQARIEAAGKVRQRG